MKHLSAGGTKRYPVTCIPAGRGNSLQFKIEPWIPSASLQLPACYCCLRSVAMNIAEPMRTRFVGGLNNPVRHCDFWYPLAYRRPSHGGRWA